MEQRLPGYIRMHKDSESKVKLALQRRPGLDVAGNLTLPTESETVQLWKSSDPSVIENDGTVHFKDTTHRRLH